MGVKYPLYSDLYIFLLLMKKQGYYNTLGFCL